MISPKIPFMSLQRIFEKRKVCHIFMNETRVIDCDISCGLNGESLRMSSTSQCLLSFLSFFAIFVVSQSSICSKQVITFFNTWRTSVFHPTRRENLPASLNWTLILYGPRRKMIKVLRSKLDIWLHVHI